jgi:hypothetical protein
MICRTMFEHHEQPLLAGPSCVRGVIRIAGNSACIVLTALTIGMLFGPLIHGFLHKSRLEFKPGERQTIRHRS